MSTVPKSPIMEMSLGLSDRSVNPTPKAIIMITLKGNVEDLPKSKCVLSIVAIYFCSISIPFLKFQIFVLLRIGTHYDNVVLCLYTRVSFRRKR
jgi:hypothetical protein